MFDPGYQSRLYQQNGRTVLSFRVQLLVVAPTGDIDKHVSINQSSGFWAINPYISVTYLPTARLEFSTRLNYQYNFRTAQMPNPPPIPGLIYTSGQAGKIVYGNIASSYEVAPRIRLGFNSYFLDSITPDRTNNLPVPHSGVHAFSAGLGGRYTFNRSNALNANVYFPVIACNGLAGLQFNLQIIHRF